MASEYAGTTQAGTTQAGTMQTADDTDSFLTLARMLARTGRPARAETVALALHETAVRRGDALLGAETADCLAYCSMMTARYEEGIGYGRMAREAWQACGRTADQARTTGVLALLFAWVGEADAITEGETALSLAERSGDPGAVVWALYAVCLGGVLLKQPQRALPFGERAVALSRQHASPSPWPFLALSEAVIWCCLQAEDGVNAASPALRQAVAHAIACTQEGLGLARRQGDGWLERLFVNNVAEYSLYVGDVVTAEAALLAFDDAAGEATSRCRATHLLVRGRTLLARGRPAEAVDLFQASLALLASRDLELTSLCQSDLADAYAGIGRFDAALAAHRAYHAAYVRRASDAAERRARLYARQREIQELRATVRAAHNQAMDLAASNEQLSREAERLLRASLEDPLTKLANRRRLEVTFLDLQTSSQTFGMAMIDVDHFKKVNDTFSHQVGDRVLCQLGELLTNGTRSHDLVTRFGGEEFAVLLRANDLATMVFICERLRRQVEGYAWETLRPGLAVTVSIGLALSTEAGTPDAVLALADSRLYVAKRSGRNRVVAASADACATPADQSGRV